jgi:uncharacterized membrane protein
MMMNRAVFVILLIPHLVFGFGPPSPKALVSPEKERTHIVITDYHDANLLKIPTTGGTSMETLIPAMILLTASLPSEAAAGPVPSALWAYAHYFSILVIFGCLSAERTLVKADMTQEEENIVIKLDLVYGLMAALLIISGLFRATDFGKGSDYYLHETLFWVKMSFSGIWGGLSLFPSLTFYRRNFRRKNEEVPPVSQQLARRLTQVINAELTAMLSIPLIATLMARGIWYWDDFPWPVGLGLAILCTAGSFYFYGRQALTWTEDEIVLKEE